MTLDFLGKKLKVGDYVVAIISPKFGVHQMIGKIITMENRNIVVECGGINKTFNKTVLASASILID